MRLAILLVTAAAAFGQGVPAVGSVAPTASSGYGFVSVSNGQNNSSATTPTVTAPQTVGAGHLLVLCARDSTNNCTVASNPVTMGAVTDTCGDSWTQIGSATPGPSTCMAAAYTVTSGCTNNQVSIQWLDAGTNYGFFDAAAVLEFSGQAGSPLDAGATQTGTSAGATVTSGTFSTAQANELVVACMGAANGSTAFSSPLIAGSTATAPAGAVNAGAYGAAMYLIEALQLTNQTAAFTMNTSGGIIKVIAFK